MKELVKENGQTGMHGGYGLTALALDSTVAFVFSDGRIAIGTEAPATATHATILSACVQEQSILLGCDDGTLRRSGHHGTTEDIVTLGRKWIDHVACGHGTIAATTGKTLHLIDIKTGKGTSIDHGSSLTGVAFDGRGKRLAASHYNGVTLHWASGGGKPLLLEWKGSHIGVAFAPDGKFVVSAMQELALHGWKMPDVKNMHMSGYPAKTRSMAWSPKARWLATSGAPSVICWPFFHKDGPMGKPPVEFDALGQIVSCVACHPKRDFIAAGLEDGTVLLFRMEDAANMLVAAGAESAVTGLAFSSNGTQLGYIRENGSVGLLDLPV